MFEVSRQLLAVINWDNPRLTMIMALPLREQTSVHVCGSSSDRRVQLTSDIRARHDTVLRTTGESVGENVGISLSTNENTVLKNRYRTGYF